MKTWFDFPQIWSSTTSSSTKYIDYNNYYIGYNDPYYTCAPTLEDVKDFTGGLVYFGTSASEVEITTPIKRHGVKMG